MKIERTKNAQRNIIAGIGFKLVSMLGPFIMRTVLLYTMGVQYLGLNSLFTSILSFLSLSELGIGSAMVYAMYKPIACDDHEAICALLNLYRKLYRIIGVVILLAVEWSQRTRQHGLQLTGRARIRRQSVRYAVYYLLILGIYIMHAQQQTFIYFQF